MIIVQVVEMVKIGIWRLGLECVRTWGTVPFSLPSSPLQHYLSEYLQLV